MEDTKKKKNFFQGLPSSPVVKNLPSSAGDMDSILVGELNSTQATRPTSHNYWALRSGAQLNQKKKIVSKHMTFSPLIFL